MRRRLAIIGSGTMARGIAAGALGTGARVTLCSRSSSNAAEAWGDVRRRLEEAGCCGLSSTDIREALTRFEVTTDRRAACEDAELVLEAAVEDVDVKRDLLQELDELLPMRAILATNTSSIGIGFLQGFLVRPTRFLGVHFVNPAERVRVVEVIPGQATSALTTANARIFLEDLNRRPILAPDTPGFIINRALMPSIVEAIRMVEAGLDPAAVDDLAGLGRAGGGPLMVADLVGLDVVLAILENLERAFAGDRFRAPVTLRELVASGRLGRKTAWGFFAYTPAGDPARAPRSSHARGPRT